MPLSKRQRSLISVLTSIPENEDNWNDFCGDRIALVLKKNCAFWKWGYHREDTVLLVPVKGKEAHLRALIRDVHADEADYISVREALRLLHILDDFTTKRVVIPPVEELMFRGVSKVVRLWWD